ncbi:hypothetical protein BDR03DRAFT_983100 [Suillus americanus]|nr:hypothetical protein BDR03DRAFT_983100 [Suillus americanus]
MFLLPKDVLVWIREWGRSPHLESRHPLRVIRAVKVVVRGSMRSDSCDIGLNQSGTVVGERMFKNQEEPVEYNDIMKREPTIQSPQSRVKRLRNGKKGKKGVRYCGCCKLLLTDSEGNNFEISEREEEAHSEDNSSEDKYCIYSVERTMRSSTQGRQERYDKVFPPSQGQALKKTDEKDKGKENTPKSPPSGNLNRAKGQSTEPTHIPKSKNNWPSVKESKKGHTKGWESEDIIMDDVDKRKNNEINDKDKHLQTQCKL